MNRYFLQLQIYLKDPYVNQIPSVSLAIVFLESAQALPHKLEVTALLLLLAL